MDDEGMDVIEEFLVKLEETEGVDGPIFTICIAESASTFTDPATDDSPIYGFCRHEWAVGFAIDRQAELKDMGIVAGIDDTIMEARIHPYEPISREENKS